MPTENKRMMGIDRDWMSAFLAREASVSAALRPPHPDVFVRLNGGDIVLRYFENVTDDTGQDFIQWKTQYITVGR